MRRRLAIGLVLAMAAGTAVFAETRANAREEPAITDREAVIAFSQAAIGRQIGDYRFVTADHETRRMADYLGRPLVVNLIYTGCIYGCPLIVQALADAASAAEAALGPDKFAILTIGFDSRDDTPDRMRAFARQQGVGGENWDFLSADAKTVERLSRQVGFVMSEATTGFEHVAQVTVVDKTGRIYQHVYGASFEAPALVEPLKALMLKGEGIAPGAAGLIERIRIFCTNYDPSTGRYAVDYSIIVALIVGGVSLMGMSIVLVLNGWRIIRGPGRTT